MSDEEFEECVTLLRAYYEDQEHAMQGAHARALWAAKKLLKDLLAPAELTAQNKTPRQ